MFDPNILKEKIELGIPNSSVEISNPRKDNEHFIATVTSKSFQDINLIEQHRMVYACLGEEFKQGMHSLSLKTKSK